MNKKELPLQIVNLNAAGIDVGSRSHFVAIEAMFVSLEFIPKITKR
jgi:hypothetical protein